MSAHDMNVDEIKRKIRKLKKLEIKIRFGNTAFSNNKQGLKEGFSKHLVWDEFFDLHPERREMKKYNLYGLLSLDKDEFKSVISEFFFSVYYRFYKENGFVNIHLYDPELLVQMGLPYDADANAVKKKFREMAKKFHPDTGGDSAKFIELMENYKKLLNR